MFAGVLSIMDGIVCSNGVRLKNKVLCRDVKKMTGRDFGMVNCEYGLVWLKCRPISNPNPSNKLDLYISLKKLFLCLAA